MKALFLSLFLSLCLLASLPVGLNAQKGATGMRPLTSLYTSLIAYWNMDETSGTRAASFETESLTLTDTNSPSNDTGKLGKAVQLIRASSQYLTIADNPSLSMGDIDFTISAWVNANSLPSTFGVHAILEKFTPGGEREYDLNMQETAGGSTVRFRFAVRDVANTTLTFTTATTFGAPSTSTWYWVMAYHDATNNQICIAINNGTADCASTSGGVRNGTAPFRVGALGDGSNTWDGLIDMVIVSKRLWTTAEKAYLYNSGNARMPL